MKLRIGKNFSIDPELINDVVSIVGRRGRGKTSTAVVLVEELTRIRGRFCVADPTGVWYGLKSSANGKKPGLPVVVMGGDHGDVPLEETAGRVIADFVADPTSPSVVLDFLKFRKSPMVRFMADFLEQLYHRNREQLMLVLDEAEQFAPQRLLKTSEDAPKARLLGATEDVVKLGRARGLVPILITQRCASLNKNVLELSGMLIAHALTGPNDRKAVNAWVENNATGDEKQIFNESLAGLPRGTAWFWQPESSVFEKVAVRARETFDSSATPGRGKKKRQPRVMAKVDLAKLEERIKSTIEKAKAENPKLLRLRLAELERELAKKSSLATLAPPKIVERTVVTKQQIAAIDRSLRSLSRLGKDLGEAMTAFSSAVAKLDNSKATKDIVESVAQLSEAARIFSDDQRAKPQVRVSTIILKDAVDPATPKVKMKLVQSAETGSGGEWAQDQDGKISGSYEFSLLEPLLTRHPLGYTKRQVSMLSGKSHRSSTFNPALKSLERKRLISVYGRQIVATDEAVALHGASVSTPKTSEQRIEMWRTALSPYERSIFDVIVGSFPGPVTRAGIAEQSGRSMTSSAFSAAIMTLRKAGLVNELTGGELRASSDVVAP
jgi:CRP-like cAMP-binding protein